MSRRSPWSWWSISSWLKRRSPDPDYDTPPSGVFVRAVPESVRFVETYDYTQVVSRNPSGPTAGAKSGRITLLTPYDGGRCFGRQAAADAERHLSASPETGKRLDAVIGHLLLDNHREVTFPANAQVDNRFGSIPITVPIRVGSDEPPVSIFNDRHAWRTVIDYTPPPRAPRIAPIQVTVELEDPDNADLPGVDLRADEGVEHLDDVAEKIAKYISFESDLTLTIQVELALPQHRKGEAPRPVLTRLALEWPTITSLEPWALRLVVGSARIPMQHNPATQTLEWFDVPLEVAVRDNVRRLDHFRTPPMRLKIEKPGELFSEETLECRVEVKVPDHLLSGVAVRIFDAAGDAARKTPVITTVVSSTVAIEMGDAFAQRRVSPFQHLHFDEIAPDSLRIADIATALKDLGFSITLNVPLSAPRRQLRQFLVASRKEGPDELVLWLSIRGLRQKTERQSRRPGYRFTSKLGSGELKLFVRGESTGDSSQAVHEMNQLHLALRERFERIRDQR